MTLGTFGGVSAILVTVAVVVALIALGVMLFRYLKNRG